MCFKKRELCKECENFPLIDLYSHDFSVEVFSPPCQYRLNFSRVKCLYPDFKKLYCSIIHYYYKHKEVFKDEQKTSFKKN